MSQIGALFSGLFGDAGQEFVNEQGGNAAVFGTKPKVAPYTPVTLADETATATAGNLANFDAVTEYLNRIAPGFSDILSKGFENTFSELRGEIPQDVADQVERSSAFKSLMGGFAGTPMAKGLTARDLGLTSLNLTQLGNNAAQQWTQVAETAYSPFTVSTSQQAAVTAANNAGEQATKQFQFNVDAAPDPGALGVFNVDAALGQQMLSLGMGAIGGIGGGSGGGGSAQSPGNYQLIGGQGSSPAYQYNASTGQYSPVPVAQPVGAWGVSDRRLKRDYIIVGKRGPYNLYEFEYDKPEGCASVRFLGFMADEVQHICPDAVIEIEGYLMIDYDKIGMRLEVI